MPRTSVPTQWPDPPFRALPFGVGSGALPQADAAYAFDQLSSAYADQFGVPICVTDSYRDYATQVRLYATKPNLAAKPGTSNHGWGTATDLCGGIQNFGTPEHEWLFVNAPVFGWFHPAWAQPDAPAPNPGTGNSAANPSPPLVLTPLP